ncbi:MAG TPA: prolyl oligopeptidase family serine peptidase [Actinomycetota bacterium]|nr:prolyl oligopeptidase family serine peptidase [Actinomycetota bacterium]
MTVLPYGAWPSPMTAEMLATAGVGLGEVRLDDGIVYWTEMRPTEGGRGVVCKGDPHTAPVDVTPRDFDARTRVHEYGGGPYTVHHGTVYFSHRSDARLYRQPEGGAPEPITRDTDGGHRYADGTITPDGRSWIGVRERHDLGPAVADVVNELVVVPTDGSAEPRALATGRDFYSSPRVSPDGDRLAWLEWDLPWMPWDGTELVVADLSADAQLDEPSLVAGRGGEESIWDPEWSPSGELVFASDRSGWWNLERMRDGERTVLHAAEAEFGYPQWVMGERSFGFLSDGRIVCMYDRDARTSIAVLDPETGELTDLDLPYDALWSGPSIDVAGSTIVFIAGSATRPAELVWLDFSARSVDVIKTSTESPLDHAYFSVPEAIDFPTDGGLTAHALFYPPASPDASGPDDARPPLIVMAHGGPTSHTTPAFDLTVQFWTSRGFGMVDVNYGGSTGYGREYRQRLNEMWGVVDLQDCVNAAKFLVDRGDVDGERLLVRGGSAGGYVVMCALTFTDVFAAGASYFGIADLVPFAEGDTHKFESRYEHTMIGPWPDAEETYRARSPINFTDLLSTPMLVLQGADDEVVPPAQAELIVAALESKHIPHAYLLFKGEGHGFRKAETVVDARNAELSFYAQILGFEPAGDVPTLAIADL